MRTRITVTDVVVLVVLAMVSLTGWALAGAFSSADSLITIDVDGKRQYVLDLSQNGIYTVHGPIGDTVVEIENGRVRVKSSPCPRKYCVKQGWVRRGAIVCVPNRLVITAGASLPEGVDAISE